MNALLTTALTVLAEEAPRNTGPDFGKASPFGLLVVVLLLLGVFFLVWSMNRHLRKLPESFNQDGAEPDAVADDGPGDTPDADPTNVGEPGGQSPG